MLNTSTPRIPSSEITDKKLYVNRREFIRAAGVATAGLGVLAAAGSAEAATPAPHGRKLENVKPSSFSVTDEKPNSWEQITTYNNFYEFGTDKDSPSLYAKTLKTEPWRVMVEGEVAKPGNWNLEDILKGQTLEERVYRLRCVEAWSMVIPWVGFPVSDFIKKVEPTSKAKFVEFYTQYDPATMPGVRQPTLRWPYIEGLRLDEAMHPLAILAVGLYGEVMPKQDGAPIRLVVPWKYGFKSAKSIVRIRFVEKQPVNTWQEMQPSEYGFYSNVNPSVDHPRWTQASERRIGEFFRRKTLMFNGYADQVASLYAGMDLKRQVLGPGGIYQTMQWRKWVLKPALVVAGLGPAAWLVYAGLTGNLSVNPLSDITNETGLWAIRFICLTLAVTPLRRVTGWNDVIRFRRMLGLFAFFYGSLHFLTYVIADRFAALDFPDGIVSWTTARNLVASVGEDVYKRPFITVGFTAFVCMVPLALTSTAGMIRRLGGRRWRALHRLIYVTGVAAVVHYWWLVKADVTDPRFYAVIVAVLLGIRLYFARSRASVPTARVARAQSPS